MARVRETPIEKSGYLRKYWNSSDSETESIRAELSLSLDSIVWGSSQ
jgi:hypothetical protein